MRSFQVVQHVRCLGCALRADHACGDLHVRSDRSDAPQPSVPGHRHERLGDDQHDVLCPCCAVQGFAERHPLQQPGNGGRNVPDHGSSHTLHPATVHALHGEGKRHVRVDLGTVENDHGHSCDDGPADIDQSGVGPVLSVHRVPRWWADLPLAERWLAKCRGLDHRDADA
jgi:hypothetical protein